MNLVIFDFYFQQIINTPLLKIVVMLDVKQASEYPNFLNGFCCVDPNPQDCYSDFFGP